MKIDYEFSGGFFYLELEYHEETKELKPELAQEIYHLVESSRVFEIDPEKVTPTPEGPPDITFHQLTISDETRNVSLQCNDVTAPPSLRPLLARLRGLAIQSRSVAG